MLTHPPGPSYLGSVDQDSLCVMTHASLCVMTQATPNPEKRHDTVTQVTGRSGRGTARQTIRVDEAKWERFDQSTKAAGIDRSAAVRAFIDWFNREPGAKIPKRPPGAGE